MYLVGIVSNSDVLTKDIHHVSVIDTNLTRIDFTRHGLHMNSTGKEKMAKIIGHKITNF
jgi:hypothetical protein